jgi:hypothetical protein
MRTTWTALGTMLTLVALCVGHASAQSQPSWQREEKSDALHGQDFSQFTLMGKYLMPPRRGTAPPVLVVKCKEGKHGQRSRQMNGKFLTGYLVVDAVLDFRQYGVPVEFRLDDGKLQTRNWTQSTDGAGAFFNALVLLCHKRAQA